MIVMPEDFFFFGGWGGVQIGVHDGYIHRFTGLKFLWIMRLELRSVEYIIYLVIN